MSMVLSILTPTFQGAAYLEACLQNVASQWIEGIEHLVVDGGSTDATKDILEKYAAQYPHVRWISEKDRGQSDAMNKAIRMAKGKWIGFLNVDDYYEPHILPKILTYIRQFEQENCLLVGNLTVRNEKDEALKLNRPAHMSLPRLLADCCEWPFNPSAYFYPAQLHEKIGYFPEEEHFAMDYDFLLKVFIHQIPVFHFDEIWGNFRLMPTAKTGIDQMENLSYERALRLRKKYFSQASGFIRLQTRIWSFIWAIRNKWWSLSQKLNV